MPDYYKKKKFFKVTCEHKNGLKKPYKKIKKNGSYFSQNVKKPPPKSSAGTRRSPYVAVSDFFSECY